MFQTYGTAALDEMELDNYEMLHDIIFQYTIPFEMTASLPCKVTHLRSLSTYCVGFINKNPTSFSFIYIM